MNDVIDDTVAWVQRTKWVRRCRYCKGEMSAPLEVEGKLYSFCSLEHKESFDLGQEQIKRLMRTQPE
jgi:hypothetical protein